MVDTMVVKLECELVDMRVAPSAVWMVLKMVGLTVVGKVVS